MMAELILSGEGYMVYETIHQVVFYPVLVLHELLNATLTMLYLAWDTNGKKLSWIVLTGAIIFTLAIYYDDRYRHSIVQIAKKVINRNQKNYETHSFLQLENKVIYSATENYMDLQALSNFSTCQFRNCLLKSSNNFTEMEDGDMLLFQFNKIPDEIPSSSPRRENQLWVVYGLESPAYSANRWNPDLVTDRFNITATYRRDSDVILPYSRMVRLSTPAASQAINYALNKTKGAFAYVSNCDSIGYDRLSLMEQLQKYIDVDIYGQCTENNPCKRGDYICEEHLHRQYRFYLSFENSLCKDYITEKFWSRLSSPGIFIPVAMGGLELEDYTRVSPPNSFLHVYNFTTVEHLGKFLQYLMIDDKAYSSYHTWRQQYTVRDIDFCELCRLVNNYVHRPVHNDLAEWWNDDACKEWSSI